MLTQNLMHHVVNEVSLTCFFLPSFFLGFHKVMEGIDKAVEMGYNPVKVAYFFFISAYT